MIERGSIECLPHTVPTRRLVHHHVLDPRAHTRRNSEHRQRERPRDPSIHPSHEQSGRLRRHQRLQLGSRGGGIRPRQLRDQNAERLHHLIGHFTAHGDISRHRLVPRSEV